MSYTLRLFYTSVYCQITSGGDCTLKDIIKLGIVFPVPVSDEPHQASAGTWQQSAYKKNLLPFKSCIAAFCDRLDLVATARSSWRLLTLWPLTWTLPVLVCVTNMFYGSLVTLEPTCSGSWVQLALEITLFWMVQTLNFCVTLYVGRIYSNKCHKQLIESNQFSGHSFSWSVAFCSIKMLPDLSLRSNHPPVESMHINL